MLLINSIIDTEQKMGNLDLALAAQDRASFNPPTKKTDVQEHLDKVYAEYRAIKDGKPWDENLEGYRADFLCEVEAILRSDSDEKLALINDSYYSNVLKYCHQLVKDQS